MLASEAPGSIAAAPIQQSRLIVISQASPACVFHKQQKVVWKVFWGAVGNLVSCVVPPM